jgi:hypothetical protein
MAGNISLESSIRTCKVDTGKAFAQVIIKNYC